MSILEELWRGRLAPGSQKVEEGTDYARYQHEFQEEEARFSESLSPEARDAYDALCEKQTFLSYMTERDSFIKGFRLAGLLALEVVSGDCSQFIQN